MDELGINDLGMDVLGINELGMDELRMNEFEWIKHLKIS